MLPLTPVALSETPAKVTELLARRLSVPVLDRVAFARVVFVVPRSARVLAAESVAAGKPQAAQDASAGTMGDEAAATPPRASQGQPDAPGEVQDVPTAKLRAQLAQREAAKAAKAKAGEAAEPTAEPIKRTPPAAPRLSAAIPPRAAKTQVRLAEENKNPWERTEGGALNAVTHHARCEAHPVERKSEAGGVRFRAAPKCRILAEAPDAPDEDGVLLG